MKTTATKGLSRSGEAVLMAAILSVRSDNKVTDSELARLRSMIYLNPLLSSIENVDETILAVWRLLDGLAEGDALEKIAEALPARLRETAFAWAAEMTHADGWIAREEHSFLSRLRIALDIHGVLAGKIKMVVEIMNRKGSNQTATSQHLLSS